MKERELTTLLASLKDDPRAGGEFDFDASWKRVSKEIGLNEQVPKASYAFRDYVEYYMWQLSHALLKPIAASGAVFAFAIIGWISVANASMSTLPGERLYPVKLSMERAQIALTVNDAQRAELRVEFASRRLEEMVEVSAMNTDSTETVQLAVDRFKDEVTNIQEVLNQENPQTDIARTVGRNVEVYSSVTSATDTLPTEVTEQVEEILEETQEQVVDVIITSHEQTQSEEDAQELNETLQRQISGLEAQYADAAAAALDAARALGEQGEYRRAFQVLKEFVVTHEAAQTTEDTSTEEAVDVTDQAGETSTEEVTEEAN